MDRRKKFALAGAACVAIGLTMWGASARSQQSESTETSSDQSSASAGPSTAGSRAARPDRSTDAKRPSNVQPASAGHSGDSPDRSEPAAGCTLLEGECPFLDPDAETLSEMARCGVVRYEIPALVGSTASSAKIPDDWAEQTGLTEQERLAFEGAAHAIAAAKRERLIALGVEAGLDQQWAAKSSLFLMWATLEYETLEDRDDAGLRVAGERSGDLPVRGEAEATSVAERAIREMAATGDELEAELARRLGRSRAHELRVAGDGWPGRRRDVGNACEAAPAEVTPPLGERKIPRTKEEADACIADWEGAGCNFLDDTPLVLEEMARCGIVRFELPSFVMVREADPSFDDAWSSAVGLTPKEAAQLSIVADQVRENYYNAVVELVVETGRERSWAQQTALMGLMGALHEYKDEKDTGMAVAAQISRERAGLTQTGPAKGADPIIEAFYRRMMGFGDEFETALGRSLSPARARELRRHANGWPGNRAQTPSQCKDE